MEKDVLLFLVLLSKILVVNSFNNGMNFGEIYNCGNVESIHRILILTPHGYYLAPELLNNTGSKLEMVKNYSLPDFGNYEKIHDSPVTITGLIVNVSGV